MTHPPCRCGESMCCREIAAVFLPQYVDARRVVACSTSLLLPTFATMHVRIIWDFFGPDAKGTAKHQIHHVHELFEREHITYYASGVGTAQRNHAMSWVEIDLDEEAAVSKALKPNRRATEPNFDKIEWDWPDVCK